MLVRKLEYVLAGFALALMLIACLASCRWGGAKVEAEVPIYGNAAIVVEPVVIDTPEGAE